MTTLRFASGFSLQYNEANYLVSTGKFSDLYTKKGGNWICRFPNEACVVDNGFPSRAYNPIGDAQDRIVLELAQLGREVRALRRRMPNKKKAKR